MAACCIAVDDALAELDSPLVTDESSIFASGPQTIKYNAPICTYQDGGTLAGSSLSICGLVALNCVRLVYKSNAEGLMDMELLRRLISQSMINDIMSITYDLQVDRHLKVDELLKVPLFEETMTTSGSALSIPSLDVLRSFLFTWFPSTSTNVLAAVFQTSEIVVCLSIPICGSRIYALFDSHPRSSHPHGPAFTLTTQLDEIASQLLSHANEVDPLHHFSARLLDSRLNAHTLDVKDMFSRSVAFLSQASLVKMTTERLSFAVSDHVALLRAPAETLRRIQSKEFSNFSGSRNARATSSTSRPPNSRKDFDRSREIQYRREFGWQKGLLTITNSDVHEDKQDHNHGLPSLSSVDTSNKENISPESSKQSEFSWLVSLMQEVGHLDGAERREDYNDVKPSLFSESEEAADTGPEAGPSRLINAGSDWVALHQEATGSNSWRDSGKASATTMPRIPWKDQQPSFSLRKNALSDQFSLDEDNYSWEVALQLQLQEEEEIAASVSNHRSGQHAWLVALQKRIMEEENLKSRIFPSSYSVRSELDWQLAVQLQQEEVGSGEDFNARRQSTPTIGSHYDDSNATNDGSPTQLTSFECGICSDTHDVGQKISLTDCGHDFCRECLRTFAETKLEEGRYPIFCPECLIERSRTNKTHVTQTILEQLNISQRDMDRLMELQLLTHSVVLSCPRCNQTMNVDRGEYGEQNVLVCPLPNCGHKWCKTCLKALASSDERHRCKNNNIDRLMRRKGWKYCPGCKTPVQKESGCNHMTCGAPGCNVHFCYRCGVLIVDTTNGGDVGATVTEHYANCKLFEKRFSCSIQ